MQVEQERVQPCLWWVQALLGMWGKAFQENLAISHSVISHGGGFCKSTSLSDASLQCLPVVPIRSQFLCSLVG